MFKRVISNPDEMGRDGDGKNAKMDVSSFASDSAPVTMECNVVVHVVETDEAAAVAASRDSEGATPPVIACIAQPSSTNSSTSSSLSDDNDNQANEEDQPHPQMSSVIDERDDNSNSEGLENAALMTQSAGLGNALGPATQAVGVALGHQRLLARAPPVKSFSAVSDRSEGSSNGASSVHGSSAGTWGWFEDVHTHDNIDISTGDLIPNGAEAVSAGKKKTSSSVPEKQPSAGNSDVNQSTAGDGTGTKKKGGLLQFGNAMSADSRALVPPPPNNNDTAAMAVTAPTYVLEESPSSQKLWKETAGNRPPQPVEERAFYEKMWAQNFTQSQVKYEIPVDVLVASSPISLSPFADGAFGEDDPDAVCEDLSNYNLTANFKPNRVGNDSGNMDGADTTASIKETEADAAEAALIHRMNHATWGFDNPRNKEYNLRSVGPHKHHHTLVNKKVNGTGKDEDSTILVRGDNVFGTTVSKAFPRSSDGGRRGVDTVSISVASYRVVESKKHGKYAQYLVIFCDGSFRNTIGVWKRYSDFDNLSRKVTNGQESCSSVLAAMHPLSVTEDHDPEHELLPNAVTSWKLLKKRQRWYRCLDASYLSLKVFLLERFLHDILFESSSPDILREFIGVDLKQR